MESRLPLPVKEALVDSEAKSGIKLLTIALAALVGTAGIAFLIWVIWGFFVAVVVSGALLIATALTLLRALGQVGQSVGRREVVDKDLVDALVALERRAVVITNLSGEVVASNAAFERLAFGAPRIIQDLLRGKKDQAALGSLLATVLTTGSGDREFITPDDERNSLLVSGKRVKRHIMWHVACDGDRQRLEHERAIIGNWDAPVFEQLGCAVVLEDSDGKLHYINKVMREWLELEPGQMPIKIQLRSGDSQLLVGNNQRIDVDVIDVPLATREHERQIGRYRFLQKSNRAGVGQFAEDHKILIDPIFDNAPVAVAVVDKQARLLEFNRPLRLHPAGKRVQPGDSVLDLVKQDDRDDLKALIENGCEGRPASLPLDVVYNAQPERVGQIVSSPVVSGTESMVILYMMDTTQEKSLERQFVQAQKMQAVGQLAGGVAHDFNNLLTAIIGFCDLLLVRHDAGDQSFSDIIQIKQNANRAANLVRQLLAFSRQQTLRPKVLMMTDVLAELSNLIRRLIGENIELKVMHGRDLQPVKVDQGQLEQVIINLAVNARDAMAGGGKLEIRTSMVGADHKLIEQYDVIVPDDYVLVEVIDTGCGIPKDNLAKIFEPFFTTKEVGQGTGLGLATVYGIVKQTGGFVFVESEEGVGTNFRLFFKAHTGGAEEGQDAKRTEAPARDLTGKGTILIVEDEDPVRMFASRALSNKGYRVLEASSGEAGLDILIDGDDTVDLLISDVIMPNMDGPTLVREARKVFPDLPVIFVSGYAEDMFRQNLEDEDFLFLPKPFSLKDLAEQVKGILG
ncbi:ATP-binding protein [Kordiimonas aestuarii]|uniref:ATP-binding protein n=1 Tax=Kordiimonas aestuarii TaxID=1005925 RepID=UPI0021D13196|nr:ATP-binding protein [Kordiimonas aestuarii]